MFVVLGGHWAILQAVAWSQMVVSYSRDAQSLSVGLEKTFNGKYPCGMCRGIAEAKQREAQNSPIFKAEKKIEVFVAQPRMAIREPAAWQFSYPVMADSRFTSRSDQPPVPVPILA